MTKKPARLDPERLAYLDPVGAALERLDAMGETLRQDYQRRTPIVINPSTPMVVESAQERREAEDKVASLERKHVEALLKLKSARRTLKLWRRGMALWLSGVAKGVIVTAGGIAGGVAGVPHTLAILLPIGIVLTAGSIIGAYTWVTKFRIEEKLISYRDIFPTTIGYVDPQLNVDLAELEYSAALRRLTEVTGDVG